MKDDLSNLHPPLSLLFSPSCYHSVQILSSDRENVLEQEGLLFPGSISAAGRRGGTMSGLVVRGGARLLRCDDGRQNNYQLTITNWDGVYVSCLGSGRKTFFIDFNISALRT